MPRLARLDAPGVLHHVMIRASPTLLYRVPSGIEERPIVDPDYIRRWKIGFEEEPNS